MALKDSWIPKVAISLWVMINHGMVAFWVVCFLSDDSFQAPAWNLQKNFIPPVTMKLWSVEGWGLTCKNRDWSCDFTEVWPVKTAAILRFYRSSHTKNGQTIPKSPWTSGNHHQMVVVYGSGFPTSSSKLFQRISTWASEPGTVRRFALRFTTRRLILHKHTRHILRSQIQDSRIETQAKLAYISKRCCGPLGYGTVSGL